MFQIEEVITSYNYQKKILCKFSEFTIAKLLEMFYSVINEKKVTKIFYYKNE